MNYGKRVCLLYCTLVIAASFLLARLYNLSKPETNKSLQVLDGQYTGKIEVCSRSGFVYDRNGYLLSHHHAGRIALVNPAECTDAVSCAEKLSETALVASCSDIYERIIRGVPFTVSLGGEKTLSVPDGVTFFDSYEENNSLAKHFLGYNNADGRGVSGLRGAYDGFLNGELYSKVAARFDTNAKRASLSSFEIDTQKYLSRDGIVTTIDKDLQSFTDGLSEQIPSGAVVVSDVNTGEILAMSSFPDYDADKIGELLDSDKGELLNRCTESFVPGSVFKMIVAASALEKDETLFDYKYTCVGEIAVGDDVFRCHNRSGHGEIDMSEAFSESCNTYFINLGSIIGLSEITDVMKELELDTVTEADFVKESRNFFPEAENERPGYLANISFGQGDLCLSPLDMVRVTSACTTGCLPELSTVFGEIREGEFVFNERGQRKKIFCENTCKKMCAMMEKCVESGTGIGAKVQDVRVGGKTATAQTGRFDEYGVEYVHKWFCGVYPADKPRISICVLIDNVTGENMSPAVIFSQICLFLKEKGL